MSIKKRNRFSVVDLLIYLFLIVFVISVIYPLYYLLMYSFSTYGGLAQEHDPFMLRPAGFTLLAYSKLFSQEYIRSGYMVTIFRSIVGPIVTVLATALTAYPLSKKDLPGRMLVTWYIMITMFVSGGMIPTFVVYRDLGLMDSLWVYILPGMVSTYYIMLMRTFFVGLPPELEEAAEIDGASVMQSFFRVILPVTMPSLVTIGCWSFFGHWNSWLDSTIYITSMNKKVLQDHIRRLVDDLGSMLMSGGTISGGKANQPTEASMRAAGIMITIGPVLIFYPFLRKYFAKGMVLGSIKG